MRTIYDGNIGRVKFTLVQGDIFDAEVESIVNSEQTDFILSINPDSISGQINQRFGPTVQPELDLATNMEVFRAGTVLGTSGGAFKRIYHAGFHEPDDWPGEAGSSSEAELFKNIGSCSDQVLQMAATEGVESVAFPLIGCGIFGLSERMLVRQFLHALVNFDRRWKGDKSVRVWLVIKDDEQTASVLNQMIDLLIEHCEKTVTISVPHTGVPTLDRFACNNLARPTDANWAKLQLYRFTEIALAFMCYGLSRAIDPASTPESLFKKGRGTSFENVRENALYIVKPFSGKLKIGWGTDFFASVLRNQHSVRALKAINDERNNLSHGRKELLVGEIERMMLEGLQLKNWEKIHQTDGELRLTEWSPWVAVSPSATGEVGLFDRWQDNEIRYLVPETGEVFNVPRKSTALG